VEKTLVLPEEATAPVESGQEAGKVVYTQDNTEIGSVRILYADSVPALTYKDCFVTVLLRFFLYA
jgi:hypothetical protein